MRASEKTYYDIKRLHVWMVCASLALVGATVWLVAADHYRPWRRYQREFQDQVADDSPPAGPGLGGRFLRAPIIDALDRPLAIEQIYLPDLTLDFHVRRVPRIDRCTTCHLGIDEPGDREPPYAAHPRLNLFVGAGSPHPMAEFGCTICHAGQGGATDFTWASHTPNEPGQRESWRRQYGWSPNRDWEHPMLPARFAESRCLQCHHEVAQLEASERFPDPPAAKLLAGYHLVRENGCFGCHEIEGFDLDGRRAGPDMRLEPAGTMRKVGPTLRDLGGQFHREFLPDWIRDPTHFRPTTRMPRFYGLHEHLDPQSAAAARRFEPVEIRAIVAYLRSVAEPVELLSPDVPVEASAARGKQLFETQGCLACHRHADFPTGQGTQGPDLSNVGSKYRGDKGRAWLASWLRDPHRHSPRTLMPNPLLQAATEEPSTDPAADMAAYLLASLGWQADPLGPVDAPSLDALAEVFGVGADELAAMTREDKLRQLGRRAIAMRGCYACHDIPGFDDAKPIGPALSDWGRKREELLAFEDVFHLAAAGTAPGDDADTDFYLRAIREQRREGFAWQKLRAPRSFDFNRAAEKPYNQWLTMGRFPFTARQREAIVTFVLSLVADPPNERYVDRPSPRRRAIVEGRKLLDKYACTSCHCLEMDHWTIKIDPAEFDEPLAVEDFPFMRPEMSAEQINASLAAGSGGLVRAELVGMPLLDDDGELLVVDDDEDAEGREILQYAFTLWQPAAIAGQTWPVGGADVLVWQNQLLARRPPWGGDFARLLYPVAIAQARAAGANVAGPEAWGWVPPPLVGEGAKVQPAWLHEYLLAPRTIRPACLLRMPRYNLSSEEAGTLADYFAAVAGTCFPYSADGSTAGDVSDAEAAERFEQHRDAMRIVSDGKTYCAKCHLIGASSPGGELSTVLAPDLERVAGRLRAEYLRRWLAHPNAVLPYTPMPVNFAPDNRPLDPALCPGESLEHLEAVSDLLLDYNGYLRRRTVGEAVE